MRFKEIKQAIDQRRLYANIARPITVPEDGIHFSEEEIRQRAFKIDSVTYKGRDIKLVSIESNMQYIKDRTDFVPADWQQQVEDAMQDTSLVFVEYFPPELELPGKAYTSRFSGINAKSWGEQMLHPIYQPIADMAAELSKPVAVCDIANKATYLLYGRNPTDKIAFTYKRSAYSVERSKYEQYVPYGVDARRMFTTLGIMKTVEGYPEGSTFMYIAAPAHINRVKYYLTKGFTRADEIRRGFYVNTMLGLDTNTRIYEHTDDGWIPTLNSGISYLGPIERFKPALLAAGVAVGGVIWARKTGKARG